eukprot:1087536-Prorocentrum_minimum.AAC.1
MCVSSCYLNEYTIASPRRHTEWDYVNPDNNQTEPITRALGASYFYADASGVLSAPLPLLAQEDP